MSKELFHIMVGSMTMTVLWSLVSWGLIRIFRLHSPVGRFIVFLAPLAAAFVARLRLSPDRGTEILTISIAVAILLIARDGIQYWLFRRRIENKAEPSPELQRLMDDLASKLNVRPPQAMVSDDPTLGPFTAGLRRPLVVVPRGLLSALNEAETGLLLMHEMAHIRRRDFLWKWLVRFLRHLSILNPAVSWAYRQLNLELERGSDRLTTTVSGKPGSLARTLVKVELFLAGRPVRRRTAVPDTISRAGAYLPLRIESLRTGHVAPNAWSTIMKVAFIFVIFRLICFKPVKIWLALLS